MTEDLKRQSNQDKSQSASAAVPVSSVVQATKNRMEEQSISAGGVTMQAAVQANSLSTLDGTEINRGEKCMADSASLSGIGTF